MNRNSLIVALTLVALITIATLVGSCGIIESREIPLGERPRFEYKVEEWFVCELNIKGHEKRINAEGEKGWELIHQGSNGVAIFKRRKQ